MYLVELSMQVLEWRITTPDNNIRSASKTKSPFSIRDILTRYMGSEYTNTIEQPTLLYPKTRMTWTGSKIGLVELIYAWEEVGCFNHGQTNIKEIASYIEVVFNIDLGDYYDTFREMRNRVNRTAFLDKLIKVLNDRMDEVDQKK